MAAFEGTDRFEVVRELGTGGMGVVYEVQDRERQERVALKTLRHTNADLVYRLKREFRALADLSHPNLVHLHELFVDGADCFFTMELVRGENLLEYCLGHSIASRETPAYDLKVEAALPTAGAPVTHIPAGQAIASDERKLREVLPQLAQGVHALHSAGKVHRDIKPSNVLVTDERRVVLLDFGLVADITPTDRQSMAGLLVGTAEYMAPEQGDGESTAASDWYSVGIILYEALTGRLPFRGPTMEVLFAKLRRAPPPPRAIVPDVPEDLDQLCIEMLAREPKRRPSGQQVLRALGVEEDATAGRARPVSIEQPARGPFAGRDVEVELLSMAHERVEGGEAAVVLIQGPSGVGKTELVGEFLRRTARRAPDRVLLQGRCYEREAVPYSAMDSLIDDLSRLWISMPKDDAAALLPRWASILPRVFPVLGRVPVVADARERVRVSHPQELRTRAFAALREVLQRLGEQYPLVLFLDDMQWVDADTVTLLSDLMRPPDPPAMILLLCSRDFAPLRQMLKDLGPTADLIALEPLDHDESIAFAKQLLGPKNRALAQWIANESGGSPFLLSELARYTQEVGELRDAAPRVDDLIANRIEALPDASRRLLEILAVASEPLSARVAGAAARMDPQALAREVRVLRVGHLVRTASRDPDMQIELYHNRLREAVLLGLPDDTRAEHHEALAVALEQHEIRSPARLARHWRRAGHRARGAEYALRAAEEAVGKLDFERAAGYLEATLADGDYDPAERRRLLVQLGEAQSNAGRPHEAARSFEAATEGADAATRLDLHRRTAEALLCGGYLEEGLRAIRAVLGEIGLTLADAPRRALARLLWQRFRLRLRGLRYKRRDASELAPAKLTRADVCWSVCAGLGFVDTIRAAEFQTRNLILALDLGEENRIARAFAMEASFLGVRGIGSRARRLTARARELAGDDLYVEAITLRAEASIDYFTDNNWSAAADKLRAAAEILRTHYSATGYDVDTCVLFASFCDMFMGDVDQLAHRVPAYVQEAERRGDRFTSVCMRTRLNILWLLRDNHDGARRNLEEALGAWLPWEQSFQVPHWYALITGCELELYAGDHAAGAAKVDAQLPALHSSLLLKVPLVHMEFTHVHGRVRLAHAVDAGHPARRAVAPMLRTLRQSHQPVAGGYADLLAAGAAGAAGDDAGAARYLRAAIDSLERLRTGLYATAARRRLGEVLGGDEGRELVDAADARMRERGVVNPARLTAMLVPGFRTR